MIEKNKIKWLNRLAMKKYRQEYGVFVAEGAKTVEELLPAFRCQSLYYTAAYTGKLPAGVSVRVTDEELRKISNMEAPQGVLAVFEMAKETPLNLRSDITLVLDGVQDAGNLGTILRAADWFGFEQVICTKGTVDVYNPKVVQATMGALARVKVTYVETADLLAVVRKEQLPLYVTDLSGKDLYESVIKSPALMVFGNEGNGVSREMRDAATDRLLLPNYPVGRKCSESLNVGVATALVCAEIRRRQR
ncbi:MAG: RNA methyltransferase [Paludibacteraceae bacterium]|nr:RNA methyltransferase [Paludibacteraceae bacterium]